MAVGSWYSRPPLRCMAVPQSPTQKAVRWALASLTPMGGVPMHPAAALLQVFPGSEWCCSLRGLVKNGVHWSLELFWGEISVNVTCEVEI